MTSSPEPAPEPRRSLGLDLGGTNIKVAVIETPGQPGGPAGRELGSTPVVARESCRTEAHRGPLGVVKRLAEVGGEALARHGPVAAAGVGLPGLFDGSGRAVLIPNLPGEWNGVPSGSRWRRRSAFRSG